MSTFKVGEICIFQNALRFPEYNGREVTILSVNETGFRPGGVLYMGYRIDIINPCGTPCVAYPHQLRKKHPPRSAKSIMREVIAKAKQPLEVPA